MTQNSLDQDTIAKLLASELRGAKPEAFFGDEEHTLVAQAVHEGKTIVTLRGREFKIKHSEKFSDTIFVNPVKGFVPCGSFNKENLKHHLE